MEPCGSLLSAAPLARALVRWKWKCECINACCRRCNDGGGGDRHKIDQCCDFRSSRSLGRQRHDGAAVVRGEHHDGAEATVLVAIALDADGDGLGVLGRRCFLWCSQHKESELLDTVVVPPCFQTDKKNKLPSEHLLEVCFFFGWHRSLLEEDVGGRQFLLITQRLSFDQTCLCLVIRVRLSVHLRTVEFRHVIDV